ncbi:glycoside hydrolase family 2 protein [Cohnella sp. GCM10027633]|uniref:beta-mannosidase n=1 Tax=unclassified Cohnella TaxID=2636738 RepID=UPI003638EBF7
MDVTRLSLNGQWQFRRAGEDGWKTGNVPGSLVADLLGLGLIEDPYYRDNEYEAMKLFEDDYEYRRSFEVTSELLAASKVLLRFEGLDTLAEVTVNGKPALSADNMFRAYEIDAKELLVAGTNEIAVAFRSPLKFIRRKHEENPIWSHVITVDGFTHLRKAHYMFGWDWGPILPDCGIWKDVEIVAIAEARWSDVTFRQEHADGSAKLRLSLRCEEIDGETNEAIVTVTSPDGSARYEAIARLNGGQAEAAIEIADPLLWWPRGYGEQPLYGVNVRLTRGDRVLDERTYRVGLRTLTVNTDADEWGRQFAFQINGVKIFSMGADYIPEDNIISYATRERSERLIQDCAAANFNTIRVWGGGYYPGDDFYDLCDEYGMIVWQDLMFACGVYELSDEFKRNANLEVADNIGRLHHHACLGLVCGNNEIEMFFEDGRIEKSEKNVTSYLNYFERDLPKLVAELAPDTFYWPGSPSSGGDLFESNGEDYGDGHFWDVWHGNKPFTEYRKTYFRYMSEFGFESLPDRKTIESFTLPGERNLFSYVMESHQKNPSGNQKILTYLSENYQYPKDMPSLAYVSQLLQAEAMRYGVEHWRRHRGRCMGALYWQLNDCWPTASWSSIDSFGRWKALHHYASRFYAPVLASACEEGTHVAFHVTNETMADVRGLLTWQLRDMAGTVYAEGGQQVHVEALSTRLVEEVDFADRLPTAASKRQLYVDYGFSVDFAEVSGGSVLFAKAKHLELRQPNIRTEVADLGDRFAVTVTAEAFAKDVMLDAPWESRFSDNYFDLSAGDRKVVQWLKPTGSECPGAAEFAEWLEVRSLIDTY